MKLSAVALALALATTACGGRSDDNASTDGGSSGTSGASGTTPSGDEAFSISTDDCDNYEASTGVTDTEILLGSSNPQSGLYAAYAELAKGYNAFLAYKNASGGVNDHQVTVKALDDGYVDPAKSKSNVETLVNDDQVFGIFNVVGTPNNLEIRGQLGTECVPNLFAATGAQQMGEPATYPWTIGSIPTYATESATFVTWLEDNKPDAKIGIVRQNDDFGEGYSLPLAKAIEGTDLTIVDEQTYNPGEADVSSQVTALKNAGADTVLVAASGLACPNALTSIKSQADWNPTTYASATCASKTLIGVSGPAAEGVLSAIYLKEPANPEWADDAGMQEYLTEGAKYGLSQDDLTNGAVVTGWNTGQMLTDTLGMAPELTRQAVMQQAYNLPGIELPMLLPGITMTTDGTADPYPIESMRMGQWNGTFFDWVGELTSFEGKTADYVG